VNVSRDLLLKFWKPLSISPEQVELQIQIWHAYRTRGALTKKNAKIGQTGGDVVTLLTFRILRPLHISGTVEARNFKQVNKSVQIE